MVIIYDLQHSTNCCMHALLVEPQVYLTHDKLPQTNKKIYQHNSKQKEQDSLLVDFGSHETML